VREIKDDFLPKQRDALPKRDLDPQVFIDTRTSLMWGVQPAYRSAAQIPQYGTFTGCPKNFLGVQSCQLDAKTSFAGFPDWRVPTADQATRLFDGRLGTEPVEWLKTAGVRFDPSSWNPAKLEQRLSLWVRDKFTVTEHRGRYIWDPTTESISAQLLVLDPGRGWEREIKPPQLRTQSVAEGCTIARAPSCKSPRDRTGGFIIWVRPTTQAERGQYW
jgi:hypothetical protein